MKSENNLKEEKLGSIEIEYDRKLAAAKCALEKAEVDGAKERSEKELLQKKVGELEHTQAQLTERIKKQDSDLEASRLKVEELKKIQDDDLKSYRKMVGVFVKAFKSEV